jgi:hypothetical protein
MTASIASWKNIRESYCDHSSLTERYPKTSLCAEDGVCIFRLEEEICPMIVVQYSTRHLVRPSAGMHAEEACHEILIRQIRSSKRTLGTTNYTRVSSYFLCLMTPENTRVWGRTHCPADIPWLCCEDQCPILQSCSPKSNDGLVSHIEWQKIAELHSSESTSLVTPFSLFHITSSPRPH